MEGAAKLLVYQEQTSHFLKNRGVHFKVCFRKELEKADYVN